VLSRKPRLLESNPCLAQASVTQIVTHWLAVKSCGADPSEDTKAAVHQLPKAVEEENYFLASVLRKHLDKVRKCLGNLCTMHLDSAEKTE
jgi:hypothetical protein